jgi:hypothetical protein
MPAQIQLLQTSLAEARKFGAEQQAAVAAATAAAEAASSSTSAAAAARDAEWKKQVSDLRTAGARFEETARQNEAERARAIAGLQGELQAARADVQKVSE